MTNTATYPIGTLGQAWGEGERTEWRARQSRRRRYDQEVLPRIDALAEAFDRVDYGRLDYAGETYILYALKSRDWDPALPSALLTGGVHGYETSGVMGGPGVPGDAGRQLCWASQSPDGALRQSVGL